MSHQNPPDPVSAAPSPPAHGSADRQQASEGAPSSESALQAEVPPPEAPAPGVEVVPGTLPTFRRRPTFVFFGVVSAISLFLDVGTKAWAEVTLTRRTPFDPPIILIEDHLALTLAYNRGGAWGLLQDANETLRRPFFLLVSLLAIAFIVSLYGRLLPRQWALKWGLPLVLGGALGNLSDRITRSSVVDFIDYRAAWVESMNRLIAKVSPGWGITEHWPTFNVADISICIGVVLMAIDMLTAHRHVDAEEPEAPARGASQRTPAHPAPKPPGSPESSPSA